MESFILYAILAGVLIASAAGPVGSVIIWKGMTQFGDALAHSALLGVALAILLDMHTVIGMMLFSICFSVLLSVMQRDTLFSNDALLGILAHSFLAIGLLVVGLMDLRIDLHRYLFGDILTVAKQDLLFIVIGVLIILVMLTYYWRSLLLVIVHKELAVTRNINVNQIRLIFLLMVSLLVALSVKIIGILLITSLMIIPAASARKITNTPESMVFYASIIGMISVVAGVMLSYYVDIMASAAIVVVAFAFFIGSGLIARYGRK